MSQPNQNEVYNPVTAREQIKTELLASHSIRPSDLDNYLGYFKGAEKDEELRELVEAEEVKQKVIQYFSELLPPTTLEDILDLVCQIKIFWRYWPNKKLENIETIDTYREQAINLLQAKIQETRLTERSGNF